MKPDSRKYSITSLQSQMLSSNGSLAVVRHDVEDGGNGYAQRADKSTPHDLIQQETLSALVKDIRELRQRCDSLEEANAELKCDVRTMSAQQSAIIMQMKPETDLPEIYEHVNLSGYASSEGSASAETAMLGRDSTIDKREFESFKEFTNKRIDAMTEILEAFKSDLNAEGVARYKLGQELERTKHDATKTKGRLGGMEVQMKDLHTDFDELATSTTGRQDGQAHIDPRDQYGSENLGLMHQQVTAVLAEMGDLTSEVRDQADIINVMQARLDGGLVCAAPEPPTAANYARRISTVNNDRKSPDFVFMQHVLEKMTRKANMQQVVDDCPSKDALHVAYSDLSRCLNENPSSDEVLAAGSFTGTWDELWSLRDRVVRRLATVDKYEQALQEAKRAEKTYL